MGCLKINTLEMLTTVVWAALMTNFNNRVTDVIGCINNTYGINTSQPGVTYYRKLVYIFKFARNY